METFQHHIGKGDNVGRDKIENLIKINSATLENGNVVLNGVNAENLNVSFTVPFSSFVEKYTVDKVREITNLRERVSELKELNEYKFEKKEILSAKIDKLTKEKALIEGQVESLLSRFKNAKYSNVSELYNKAYNEFLNGNIEEALNHLNEETLTSLEQEVKIRQGLEIDMLKQNRTLRESVQNKKIN